MKKIFISFLKEHRAYSAYMRNSEKSRISIFEVVEPFKYLCGAFVWEDTKEGFNYWFALDKEWRRELGLCD